MKHLLIITGYVFISGCMQVADPKNVAQQYWQAMQLGDYAKARSLVSTDSQSEFDDFVNRPEDQRPALNAVALTDSKTTVTTIINSGNQSTQFDTTLVMQNGQWLIDASASQIPPPHSALEQRMDDIAEKLSEAIDGNTEKLEQAMAEGMSMLNGLLQSSTQELDDSLNTSLDNLNALIHEAMRRLEAQDRQKSRRQPAVPEEPPI